MEIRDKSDCDLIPIMKDPDLFTPRSYYNPISYLKGGMPLWISIDEHRCIVAFLDRNYTENETKELKEFALKAIFSYKH